MMLWILMVACGLLTFAIRYSFIAAEGHFKPAPWFVLLLPFVPVAALTAIVAPELVLVGGSFSPGPDNARLYAGIVAIAIAARWRNTLLTIAGGFAALHLIQHL